MIDETRLSERSAVQIALDKRELARQIMAAALQKVERLGFKVAVHGCGTRKVITENKLVFYHPDFE